MDQTKFLQAVKKELIECGDAMSRQLSVNLYWRPEFGSIVRMGFFEYEVVEYRRRFLGLTEPRPGDRAPFRLKMLHTIHNVYLDAFEDDFVLVYV